MNKFHSGSLIAVLLITCLMTLGGVALAGDPQEDDEKKIEVRVIQQCGGDDCDGEKRVHKIMIDADGEVHGLDGDDFTWVSDGGEKRIHIQKIIGAHPGRHFRFRFGNEGGGFLGVSLTELTPELRQHFGVPAGAGVMVSKVVDDSPAMKAGLRAGDIITGVSGETVESGHGLASRIRQQEDGAVVTLEVWRDGQMESIDAMVEEREGMDRGSFDLDCGDEDGQCHAFLGATEGYDEACGGEDQCEIKIQCQGEGDCECTVNGDTTECESLPGYNALHGE